MHFKPLTQTGKEAWPQADGPMDLAAFDNRYKENRIALFDELRVRTFGFNAGKLLIDDLHDIALSLDRNMTNLYRWVCRDFVQMRDLQDELKLLRTRVDNALDDTHHPKGADKSDVVALLKQTLHLRDEELTAWEKK